MKSQKSRI